MPVLEQLPMKVSMNEIWPLRGATLGFNLNCLVKMHSGSPFNFYGTGAVTAFATQTGTVHCDELVPPTWFDYLWVAFLVFEHFALTIMLPFWGAKQLQKVAWPKMDKDKGASSAPYNTALLLAALPVLSVGCFGEVAQHIFDNWLYLGLVPSYYLAAFYSGIVGGSGLLALGIWKGKPPKIIRFGLPSSTLVVFVVISVAYSYCNGLAKDAANAKEPKLNGASAAFEKCMSDPTLLIFAWAPTFLALGLWTVALFLKSNASNQLKCGSSFFTAVVWLILGIGSSILITVTGHQYWHVITAGSFFGLFWTELNFVTKVVPNSYTSSNQASV